MWGICTALKVSVLVLAALKVQSAVLCGNNDTFCKGDWCYIRINWLSEKSVYCFTGFDHIATSGCAFDDPSNSTHCFCNQTYCNQNTAVLPQYRQNLKCFSKRADTNISVSCLGVSCGFMETSFTHYSTKTRTKTTTRFCAPTTTPDLGFPGLQYLTGINHFNSCYSMHFISDDLSELVSRDVCSCSENMCNQNLNFNISRSNKLINCILSTSADVHSSSNISNKCTGQLCFSLLNFSTVQKGCINVSNTDQVLNRSTQLTSMDQTLSFKYNFCTWEYCNQLNKRTHEWKKPFLTVIFMFATVFGLAFVAVGLAAQFWCATHCFSHKYSIV